MRAAPNKLLLVGLELKLVIAGCLLYQLLIYFFFFFFFFFFLLLNVFFFVFFSVSPSLFYILQIQNILLQIYNFTK